MYNKSYGTVNVHAGVVMDVKDGKVYIVEANVNNTNKGKRGSSCWINWNCRGYYYSTGRWYTNKHLVNTVIKGSGGYVMRYTFPDYEETPIQTTTDQGTYNQIDNEKKASNISLGINMKKVPEDVRIGQPIGLRGTVSSSNNIEYIYGAIIDIEGNFIQQTEDWPKNSKNVSVAPLNLNQRLLFDKLSEGYYTLYIYATDGYGSAVYTKSFKVGNPAPRCYGYSTVADGYYKIRTMGYKVLDVYNAGISNEDNVQIYDDGNAGNQVFLFTQQKDGSYTISPKHAPDKTLDVSGGYAQNGGNIQIYDKNGTLAQKFYLFDNGDGTFIIASAKNINCVLDVQDRKESTNYANIQVWDRHGDSNQRFFLERVN